jgi:hypothetical protein
VDVHPFKSNVLALILRRFKLASSKEGARSSFHRLADMRHIFFKKNTFIGNQILSRDYETNQNCLVFSDFITMPPHAENITCEDTTERIPPYAV